MELWRHHRATRQRLPPEPAEPSVRRRGAEGSRPRDVAAASARRAWNDKAAQCATATAPPSAGSAVSVRSVQRRGWGNARLDLADLDFAQHATAFDAAADGPHAGHARLARQFVVAAQHGAACLGVGAKVAIAVVEMAAARFLSRSAGLLQAGGPLLAGLTAQAQRTLVLVACLD